jgi:hypothetical protein
MYNMLGLCECEPSNTTCFSCCRALHAPAAGTVSYRAALDHVQRTQAAVASSIEAAPAVLTKGAGGANRVGCVIARLGAWDK